MLRTGHRYGIPVFPGVATPTEAVRAMELGADALTLYPATAYQPSWVSDVRAIIPQAAILPIGGITLQAAPDWVAAGAVAVGMGSALTDGDRDDRHQAAHRTPGPPGRLARSAVAARGAGSRI